MFSYFITGTDTGIGKTWGTLALMKALQQQGRHVSGMKPIASGCKKNLQGLYNDDALKLLAQANQDLSLYNTVNPYPLAMEAPPHIAATDQGIHIELSKIAAALTSLQQVHDMVLVEGIGGWCVPLTADMMLADLVNKLDIPVILVVGIRLGCINHSLATASAIHADGAKLQGWLANYLQPDYIAYQLTIDTLKERIDAPFLGALPYMQTLDVKLAAKHINTSALMT